MKIRLEITDRDALITGSPKGYRIAYINVEYRSRIYYPIGVHLIARWLHRAYEWTFRYKPSKMEQMLIEAESRGADRAYKYWAKFIEQQKARLARLTQPWDEK